MSTANVQPDRLFVEKEILPKGSRRSMWECLGRRKRSGGLSQIVERYLVL